MTLKVILYIGQRSGYTSCPCETQRPMCIMTDEGFGQAVTRIVTDHVDKGDSLYINVTQSNRSSVGYAKTNHEETVVHWVHKIRNYLTFGNKAAPRSQERLVDFITAYDIKKTVKEEILEIIRGNAEVARKWLRDKGHSISDTTDPYSSEYISELDVVITF